MPLWVLKQHGYFRRRVREIAALHPHLTVVTLATRKDADALLQSIQPREAMSGSSNGSARQKTPPLTET
jgi:transcriptional regulator of nitric oxide reductase